MEESVDVWADDQMERKPSAEFLTTYLIKNPHIKVLNVNSPWGAGKSFFLERWAKMLSESHVCVSFNAWETDYAAEPLVALITCMESQLADPVSIESNEVAKNIVNKGSMLVKKAAPLIVKGLVKKFSGVELDELLSGTEDAVDNVVEALIEDQARTKDDVADFKSEVQRRLGQAAENRGLIAPAFIFIDELDRCRPTYAIELLERIKHFFELEDCRFIIASDSVQLAHAIRAVYGAGFASERYLNRFFDAEFNLDNGNIFSLVQSILPKIDSLRLGINVSGAYSRGSYVDSSEFRYPQKNTIVCSVPGYTENAIVIVGLARYFNVELRELVNYVKQIKSAADSLGGKIDFFWLAFLVFYKNSKSESYQVFFDKEKGEKAFREFDANKTTNVTFSFGVALDTVAAIAMYYWALLQADVEQLRSMSQATSHWRSEVYYGCINDIGRLFAYRNVVDLAYRLS
ncbi:KAP family NTPase [Pseudomonas guariconensis]|uniref:KAP family P-loop NTPase fold protein n=1 Tax=Pseudomonas TaxID=286 RepID=UPI0020982A40|nr:MULTISPECIES: P-loop NTPase fold protein [Pseudomonas]MCO7637565.1 KAP family NTPase [Pseudomonas sp. S 311-6]MCO7515238.1 KAP family NTPase [Pseudomonas putida]MCO7565024.1 KAP family NTPase [Pseudomonas mosselii]MCO7604302.1 KAP family NTPase [Pseudomonas guariconensis]MCO7616526.1 KAP family NTPase [Pseudomonas guariconensis]